MQSPLKQFVAAATAFALGVSPTMASAATSASQPISPLIAVSLFGTQASVQAVCSQAASAVAAQGAAGCVLPATDAPPPIAQAPVSQPLAGANFGVNWLLLGLGSIALLAGISTLFNDDDDGDDRPISPN